MARFVLNTETDFTASALVNFLTEKYGTKKGGTEFTFQDIQQYMRRGYLPKAYGHHPLKWITSEDIGLKIIRVDISKTHKKK